MHCLVCGISESKKVIFPTLEHLCSACFAWAYNCMEWMKGRFSTNDLHKWMENLKLCQ